MGNSVGGKNTTSLRSRTRASRFECGKIPTERKAGSLSPTRRDLPENVSWTARREPNTKSWTISRTTDLPPRNFLENRRTGNRCGRLSTVTEKFFEFVETMAKPPDSWKPTIPRRRLTDIAIGRRNCAFPPTSTGSRKSAAKCMRNSPTSKPPECASSKPTFSESTVFRRSERRACSRGTSTCKRE